MNKFKMILLLIVLVVLADFAWENKALPPQELKLFTFTLGQIPTFLLAYIGLALGLMRGLARPCAPDQEEETAGRGSVLAQEKQAQAQQSQEASQLGQAAIRICRNKKTARVPRARPADIPKAPRSP